MLPVYLQDLSPPVAASTTAARAEDGELKAPIVPVAAPAKSPCWCWWWWAATYGYILEAEDTNDGGGEDDEDDELFVAVLL